MRFLDWAVVVVYLVYVIWDGVRMTKHSGSAEGYFLANRSLPWWAVGLSVMATQLSAVTLIGTTGQGATDGMRFIQFYFGLPLADAARRGLIAPLGALIYAGSTWNQPDRPALVAVALVQTGKGGDVGAQIGQHVAGGEVDDVHRARYSRQRSMARRTARFSHARGREAR